MSRHIFVTGGSGYIGSRLIQSLLEKGDRVTALARSGSEFKVPRGAAVAIGDPLAGEGYAAQLGGVDALVHLVGVPHPNPRKAPLFRTIDLASARIAIDSATKAQCPHFVYVSVAHPAPVMKDYVAARIEAEAHLRSSGLRATILRPWYVLGPGHRWPYALLPFYFLLERVPATRVSALRLGLITVQQMVAALAYAVHHPPTSIRIVEVPEIRTSPDDELR